MDVADEKRQYRDEENAGGRMSLDWANIKSITVPEGAVAKITNAAGTIIWEEWKGYPYEKVSYKWEKYNAKVTYSENIGSTNVWDETSGSGTVYCGTSVTCDSRGVTINNARTTDAQTYLFSSYTSYPYSSWVGSGTVYYFPGSNRTAYRVTASESKSRGSYIGVVTSAERSTYPNNDIQNGYWYVYDSELTETVYSDYNLNQGVQSTLTISSNPTGYTSVWVDANGMIHGNGTAYSARWRTYYRQYQSTYPYIYYNSAWYVIMSANSTTAAVKPLTTKIE